MKYGIVYFKDTDNIGDDIQNYAALRFLPRLDYLIDRENIDSFQSENGELVATIMNGWFLHKKYNWPPADCIIPLCIAMHFSPNDRWGIKYGFLDGLGGEYLRAYQPIGCRDTSTLKILREKGIEAFLSGCLTLTLPCRKKDEKAEKYICLVDLKTETEQRIEDRLKGSGIKCMKLTHWVDYKQNPLSWEQRMLNVEKLLDVYQNASCVITKRLHCALPCLAMGVPVLLLFDKHYDDETRYSHFVNLLNVTTEAEFMNGKMNEFITRPIENKTDYLEEATFIEKRITDFLNRIEKAEPEEKVSDLKLFSADREQRLTWQTNLLKNTASYTSDEIERLLQENAEQRIERDNKVVQLSREYGAQIEQLQTLLNSGKQENDRINRIILEKDAEIGRINAVVREKDAEIEKSNEAVYHKDAVIDDLKKGIYNLCDLTEQVQKCSYSWNIHFNNDFRQMSFWKKLRFLARMTSGKWKGEDRDTREKYHNIMTIMDNLRKY